LRRTALVDTRRETVMPSRAPPVGRLAAKTVNS